MTSGADPQPAYPQYAHQLQALLRRLAREDREAIGANLRRGGFGKREIEPGEAVSPGRVRVTSDAGSHTFSPSREATKIRQRIANAGSGGGRTTSVDFSRASPLSADRRQTGPVRIPHFDMVRISRTVVPCAKDGRTHPRYPDRSGIAAAHHSYVTRGGVADFETHLDYITRVTAVEKNDTALLIDMLDMDEDRRLQNHLAIISNIPGGRTRERSLFEAAERCERQAKGGTLQVSTHYADDWMLLATRQDAPGWVRKAAVTLQQKRLAQEAKAKAKGNALVNTIVDIAKVNLEEAYDRLVWCDDQKDLPKAARPNWKAGPCGRIQTRFVGEFPRGLKPAERRLALERFCEHLAAEGWMYVAAIHRPDATNDPDNFHFHIDGYDRPARWLTAKEINDERKPRQPFEGDGCWDFEYSERKRNGKFCYPYRQNKIAESTRDVPKDGEKAVSHFVAGQRYVKALRKRYVDIVNKVVDGRAGSPVYVTGPYRDARIRLTPMEHLGSAITASEARGEVTAAGTRNAHIRYNDEMRLLLEQADLDRLENGFKAAIQLSQRILAASLKATAHWQELANAAVTRRCQAGLVAVVERMVRSRAETVLRVGTASPSVQDEARAWLGEIDAIVAPTPQQARAAARLEDLDGKVEKAWAEVVAVTGNGRERLRYIPADPAKLKPLKPISPAYRPQVDERLFTWLIKHRRSHGHLRFVPGGYAIDETVPSAIHRLFRLLGDEPEIQKLLLAERERRKIAAASAAVSRDLMHQDHGGRSILPGEGFGQALTVADRGADGGQSRTLADIDSLQDVELLQTLSTIQARRRWKATVAPAAGAEELAATSPIDVPEPSPANRASKGKSTGLLGQAVAAVGDRQAAYPQSGMSGGKRRTGSRGPAVGVTSQTSKKGQER
ncbi:hypothetical protein NZL82_13055 [Sphingomonas sanguinis]|uniref:hypothetical protein n=1 Tax=Sphingomonas sp. LC-1 TaxID=3110957 RepID=UPI0021BA52FC|nr:hypothetical protein [Sphingomonas sp. LC-1]MCT8002803.1 hypothetical protein [Sphingomonas sp. LC-1]